MTWRHGYEETKKKDLKARNMVTVKHGEMKTGWGHDEGTERRWKYDGDIP